MKTIKEVAKERGVTVGAVRKWIENGLKYTVDPNSPIRRLLFDERDVVEYLENRNR